MKIPIFPLSVYLLPQGITRLRIFEQRYLNMVKNCHNTNGFVISYDQYSSNTNISNSIASWGSWVEIINFMQGDDGILIIDVKCKSLVDIHSTSINSENLMFGEVKLRKHWADTVANQKQAELTQQLIQVFNEYKQLADLYPQVFQGDAHWVCARWLELLPLTFADKSIFSSKDSFTKTVEFLTQIIIEEKNK